MNITLVNPIAVTPAYATRDFFLPPKLPNLAADPQSLRESNAVELGSELARRGHRVTVVVGGAYMDGGELAVTERLRVVPVPTRLRVPFHPGLVPLTPDLARHPAIRDADVVQVGEFHQPSTFFAALAAKDRSVPLVVWQETFRRMRFPGSLYQRTFESAVGGYVRSASRRFVPRTTRAREFLRNLGIDDRRISQWIPTGIDTDTYRPRRRPGSGRTYGWPEGAHVLLLVARLHPSKGIEFAVRLVKWLLRREPLVRLVVRGSGPELGRLQRLVAELGIQGAVRVLDRLPREAMVDLYNDAEVVLCTSENDLLPFALIEGSACGRPCVSSNVGAVRDIVRDGSTGIVVREWGLGAYGQAVLSLIQDEERRAAYGRAARDWAQERFSLPVVAEHLSEVYRGVAG